MTRLREGPSEVTPGHGGRVERRPDVIRGRISFVSIHTRPTVARDPSPEVYRADREARCSKLYPSMICMGKGLKPLHIAGRWLKKPTHASAPSVAPERHRPVARPRAPPRSMPCHRRWVQAGSGRDSTMFLSCGITAGDGSHRVPLTAESVRKQGRTKKRTLPSRPVRPPWRPEDAQTVRARACGSGLTTLVDGKIRRHRRHARA